MGRWVHYLVDEIEWKYEFIRKRTLNITVFDVSIVEFRYCGGSACVGSVTRNVLKGSRGAGESCTCAVPVDEPDSSAWLSVWGVSVCRFVFLTLAASNVRNSTFRQLWGTHYTKIVEAKGPGWWVGKL